MFIHNPTTDLFWSNKFGWTDLSQADQIPTEEASQNRLPIGGFWLTDEDARLIDIRKKEDG